MFGYTISGLSVASDLALPGLIDAAPRAQGSGVSDVDVEIAAGPVPDALADPAAQGPNWQLAPGEFLLRIPGIIRMRISHGRKIIYEGENGSDPSRAAIFVSGSGFGVLMHQRRRCILHASAVEVDGHAVLFCGVSGAGKSTLAAALGRAGYRLLADDQCGLSGIAGAPSGATPMIHPDGRAMKLWQNAIDRLALGQRSGEAVRPQIGKFFVWPDDSVVEPLPLGAIYVLREARASGGTPAQPAQPQIARLNLADAAIAVRANAYRPALVRRMEQGGLYLEAAAAIEAVGGIHSFTRPLGFDAMNDGIAALEAHWRTLGRILRRTVARNPDAEPEALA
jgi:hypothetical protein